MSLCVIDGINPQLPGKTKGKPSLTACEYVNTCSNLTINGCYCGVAKCWHRPLGWIGAESEDGGAGPSHRISNTDFFFFWLNRVFVVMLGLLTAVASFVAGHRL